MGRPQWKVKRNDNRIGLQDLVNGLLFSLQAEGRSARTIEYYNDLLHPLIGQAKDKGWLDDVSSLDPHSMREFLSWVHSKLTMFAGASALNIGGSPEDLDGDENLDQVYHFNAQETDLSIDSTEACLTGMTTNNIYFEGFDSVRIVPPSDSNAGGQDKSKYKKIILTPK